MNKKHCAVPVLTIAAVLCVPMLIAYAGDSPLDPPAGSPSDTMRTLDEIYDAILLNGVPGNIASRKATTLALGDGGSVNVGSSGAGVLHSLSVHTSGVSIKNALGVEVGRVLAQATRREGGNLGYDSTYQVIFDVPIELPMTLMDLGDGQSSSFTVIYTE